MMAFSLEDSQVATYLYSDKTYRQIQIALIWEVILAYFTHQSKTPLIQQPANGLDLE